MKFCPKGVKIQESKLDFIIFMKQIVDVIITFPVKAILTQWTII